MDYLVLVKRVDSLKHLDEEVPHNSFIKKRPFFLVLLYQFEQVSPVSIFKHNAQTLGLILKEGFLVPNHILMVY